MKIWQIVTLIACVLVVAASILASNFRQGPSATSDDQLVQVAVQALHDNGQGAKEQGYGLNTSDKSPYVSGRDNKSATIIVPYTTYFGPVLDIKVDLVFNSQKKTWEATSYSNGSIFGGMYPVRHGSTE